MTDTIHTAMIAIMSEVGYVQKSGQMQGSASYRFAGEAEFIKTIRPVMVAHGVYVYPSAILGHESDTYSTSGNPPRVMNMEKVQMQFTFVHAPSGTSINVVAMGAGADTGDKAIPKMLTGALKYALRQAFLIETGDDPDNHSSDDQERGHERQRGSSHGRPPFIPNLHQKVGLAPVPNFDDALSEAIDKAQVPGEAVALHLGSKADTWEALLPVAQAYCEGKKITAAQLVAEVQAKVQE